MVVAKVVKAAGGWRVVSVKNGTFLCHPKKTKKAAQHTADLINKKAGGS